MRRFRDFDTAEDAVQEALLAAATQWPESGVPDNPRGWLIQVAFRRMTDQYRADPARAGDASSSPVSEDPDQQIVAPPDADHGSERDDGLVLLFMCCHPALTTRVGDGADAACGRRPDDGGDRGGVHGARSDHGAADQPREAEHQGLGRAVPHAGHRRVAGPPQRRPSRPVSDLQRRLRNERRRRSLVRLDLSNEAIRLARMLHRALPDDAEVTGLLALMLLTDARRPARVGSDGELISLAEQDRIEMGSARDRRRCRARHRGVAAW